MKKILAVTTIALTAIELEILREACETLREQALVEVMYSTGCRLSEVSGIRRSDVDWSSGSIRVNCLFCKFSNERTGRLKDFCKCGL